MKSLLLVAVAGLAAVIPAGQASAQAFLGNSPMASQPRAMEGSFAHRHTFDQAFGQQRGRACDGRGFRDDRRDGRDRRRNISACDFAGLPWGYYDQDINRSWESDSFNDWWHDRPDRAFPRWVSHNQDCTPDRMWWSGSGWHC